MGDLGEDQLGSGGGESEDEDGDDDPPPDHLLVAQLPPLLDQVVLQDRGGHSSPLLSTHRVRRLSTRILCRQAGAPTIGAREPKLVPVMGTQLVLKSAHGPGQAHRSTLPSQT